MDGNPIFFIFTLDSFTDFDKQAQQHNIAQRENHKHFYCVFLLSDNNTPRKSYALMGTRSLLPSFSSPKLGPTLIRFNWVGQTSFPQ